MDIAPSTVGDGTVVSMKLRDGVPVLRRAERSVQVGLRRPLVLDDMTDDEARFLASLEGRAVDVSNRERREFPRAVAALEGAPHLLDADGGEALRGVSVRWRGADAVAVEAARTVALAGVSTMSAIDARAAGPRDPFAASSRGLSRADALARAVRETGVDVRWVSPETMTTVEVLRTHGGPDLVAARVLLARDTPHLLVVSDEDGVTVGPLVRPGRTACAACCAAHRADRDPSWPVLALQLGGPGRDAAARPSAVCAALAGTLAAVELVALLRGAPREGGAWTVSSRGDATWESVAPHPSCGCGAAGEIGDRDAAREASGPFVRRPSQRASASPTISRISRP